MDGLRCGPARPREVAAYSRVVRATKRPAIEGSCLCGAVTLAAARKPRTVTQCNCSICRRYGTLWAYYKRRDMKVAAPRSGLVAFTVKPKGRRFVRCATCGCIASWELARGQDAWVGLNARLFDPAAIANVRINVLDGADTWRVVAKYQQPAQFVSSR